MKSLILYGTSNPDHSKDHYQAIHWLGGQYFIRAQMVEGLDPADALDKAKPQRGETVLNAVCVEN